MTASTDNDNSDHDNPTGRKLTFGDDTVKYFDSASEGTVATGGLLSVQNQQRRLSYQPQKANSPVKKSTSVGQSRPEWYSDLSEEQITMFKQVFELLDRDGDHTLDTDELFELLGNLDVCPDKEEIRSILVELDSDGDGVIDFMEFLYAMAESDRYIDMLAGEDDSELAERQRQGGSKYSKRQSLFFTAITKFAMKNSLSDVERYYNAKARHAPHVIGHYTAGARLLGLTDRQMERHYADLAKAAENLKSPYAKPLHFVTMVDRKKAKRKSDQIRVKIGQPAAPPCRGRRSAIAHEDDELSTLREQLSKLAEEGSVIAKIPDVHLLKPLRNKIASGELARELEQTKQRKAHALDHHHHIDDHAQLTGGNQQSHGGTHPHRNRHGASTPRQQRHVKQVPTRDKQPSWRIPSISQDRVRVPLPFMTKDVNGKVCPITVEDLPAIRKKVAKKLNSYYDKLRWRTVHTAWEHWGELHVDQFPSDYLKDNFRRVYQAYSPHTKDEAFVIAPWMPPPSPGKYGCYGLVTRSCSAKQHRNTDFDNCRPATSMF